MILPRCSLGSNQQFNFPFQHQIPHLLVHDDQIRPSGMLLDIIPGVVLVVRQVLVQGAEVTAHINLDRFDDSAENELFQVGGIDHFRFIEFFPSVLWKVVEYRSSIVFFEKFPILPEVRPLHEMDVC